MQEQVLIYLRAIHYLLTKRSEDRFVAHCLDLDVAVSGSTVEDTFRRLDELVVFHVEGILFSGRYQDAFTPAPREYWSQFNAAENLGNRPQLVIRVPNLNRPTESDKDFETLMPGITQAVVADQQNAL